MPSCSKKAGLLFSSVIEGMTLTGIAPFFPGIAVQKGFPEWMIGMVFSVAPLASFLATPLVPKLMEKLGRKTVSLLSSFFMGIGNLLLAFVLFTPLSASIILSFSGRSMIGLGYAFGLISTYTTLTSDFPDQATKMIAWIEILSAVGLTIGPTYGAIMFSVAGYEFACLSFTVINFCMIPTLMFFLGKMRKYEIVAEETLSFLELIKKPKIGLDFTIQLMVMLSIGFLLSTLEFHLMSFSLNEEEVGFIFSAVSFFYLFSSFIVSLFPDKWNKPRIMFFGLGLMIVGYTMTGPNLYILPNKLIIVIFGLSLVGFSCGFMYVFTMPHMLEVAVSEYKYAKDDRLNDALSGLTSASLCLGEIIGPTLGSLLYAELGFSISTDFYTIFLLLVFIIYGVFSDAFRKLKKNRLVLNTVSSETA